MKFTHEVRYDAPLADVYAMLTDPAFREKGTLATGATSAAVQIDGGSVRIDLERPNDKIPAFAQKVFGATSKATQSETWRDGTTADFKVTVSGAPLVISGTRSLVADGAATIDRLDGEAKVKVPLLGGKLEGLAKDETKAGWDAEHGVGMAWLAGERG